MPTAARRRTAPRRRPRLPVADQAFASSAHHRPLSFQLRKKAAYFAPHFRASGEALPVSANQSNQLVAFVDRHQIIFRWRSAANMANAIYKQSLTSGSIPFSTGFVSTMSVPGIQRQQRFRRSRRARIQSGHFSLRRALEKESHAQSGPSSCPTVHRSIENPRRNSTRRGTRLYFEPACPLEKNCASIASANQLAAGGFHQVLVGGAKFAAAQLATFHRRRLRANCRRVANALSCCGEALDGTFQSALPSARRRRARRHCGCYSAVAPSDTNPVCESAAARSSTTIEVTSGAAS